MKGIVLAGGMGTRMAPLTKVTNKHLLPVYDEPMVFKPIGTLIDSGITDILIVLGGESVGDFVRLLGSGKDFGATFTYRYQDRAGGIAEALSLAEPFCSGGKVAVILGDNVFQGSFSRAVQEFETDAEYGCYLFLKKVPDPERFGVAEVDGTGRILSIEEKPQEPKSDLCVTGLYFYDGDVFQRIRNVVETVGYSDRGELEITDVNNLYVKNGKARSIVLDGFWSDAGKFETLLKCSNFVAQGRQ
jgi:glucose-1-phosphate thymidylyltransferase